MTTIPATEFCRHLNTWLSKLVAGERIAVRSRKHGDFILKSKLLTDNKK